jgi:Pyruvate/2-oxoacid:ferredoxin oxidoreductase gamma subunit
MGDPKSLSIVFASSGGSGVMTAGVIFLRAAAGYYGRMTQLLRLGSWQRVRVIGVY